MTWTAGQRLYPARGVVRYEPQVGDWVEARRPFGTMYTFFYFGQVASVEQDWVDLHTGDTVSRPDYTFRKLDELEVLACPELPMGFRSERSSDE